MKQIQKSSALCVCVFAAQSTLAQITQMQDVVVIAKPIVEQTRVDDQASVSSVLTQDQIQDLNSTDLASALRRTPGVSISRYNPVGSYGGDQGGAVFIRGMGVSRPGSEIKTYVDDVPFYMPVWNHPLLDMLPLNGMSSVTVNKGPQPHINGNNFASINLQTKSPQEQGVDGNARVSVGKFNTITEQADFVGKTDSLELSLAQGHAKSDGHRVNASGELNNAMGRLAAKLSQNWRAGITFLGVDTKAGDPGDNPAHYDVNASSLSVFLAHKHEAIEGEVKAYKNSGKSKWLQYSADWGGGNNSQYDFEMSGYRVKETLRLTKFTQLLFGLDHDAMEGKTTNINNGTSTSLPLFKITSPYASVVNRANLSNDWTLVSSATLRTYQHNYYESAQSPAVGFSLVGNSVTYFVNSSRGINYAGLDGPALQADGMRNSTWQSLKAEKSDHMEYGFKWSPQESMEIYASAFNDKVSDRYFNTGTGGGFFSTGAFTNKGTEVSILQKLSSRWSVFGAATYLDPTISNLPYAPKNSYTLGVTGKAGPIKVALDAQKQSDFYSLNWDRRNGGSTAANTEKMNGFTVVNTRFAYPTKTLGKRGELFVAIENLFNKEYAYRTNYPMPGRWSQVGVVASF